MLKQRHIYKIYQYFIVGGVFCMKPLHNITFCPTGINDEDISRAISKKIIKLGGYYSKDLTRQVNVLIIGQTKITNKYKFAVRHRYDMIFINVDVIDILYERWLAGDDIAMTNELKKTDGESVTTSTLNMLRMRYSSHALENFYVFIGRIENYSIDEVEKLCHLQKCYKCNSTHFVKDCNIRSDVNTVLFITDSLHGARARAALEQNIAIVHYKWVLDCYKRKAMLEYDPHYLLSKIPPNTPFEKIGLGSCECWDSLENPKMSNLLESNDPTVTATSTTSANLFSKFKSQGDKIWQKAMSGDSKSSHTLPSTTRLLPLPLPSSSAAEGEAKNESVFKNCTFHIAEAFPDSHSKILKRVIEQNSGVVDPTDAKYVVVPSNVPLNKLFDVKLEEIDKIVVTEFFIERCLHYKTLISPPDSWSKPFYLSSDVRLNPSKSLLHNSNQMLQVAITGFNGVELLHLDKILQIMKPMGIKFTEYLNKTTDLLIINLSSLSSIPHTHPLWKNKYGDLFTMQMETDNRMSSRVFRNSMKRKIEFVKQEHSIPVVTPAFLIDLLLHTSKLKSKKEVVYLNNVNWCIICPRGVKENFTVELVSRDKLDHKKDIPFSTSLPSKGCTIKETRLEVLEKVKHSDISKAPRKRTQHSITNDSINSKIETPSSSVDVKRIRTNTSLNLKITRSSSWGNMMSEQVDNKGNTSSENIELQPISANVDTELSHTQVTYGTSTEGINMSRPVRKLTRKHMKDLGI